jgi:hypothetical protein
VAGRHHLVVPSLVADVRVPEEPEVLERPTAEPEPAATGVAGR